MAWYLYRFLGSDDEREWREITPADEVFSDRHSEARKFVLPHPSWDIESAVKIAARTVEHSRLRTIRHLRLQRRKGTFRVRSEWATVAAWRDGQAVPV